MIISISRSRFTITPISGIFSFSRIIQIQSCIPFILMIEDTGIGLNFCCFLHPFVFITAVLFLQFRIGNTDAKIIGPVFINRMSPLCFNPCILNLPSFNW